MSTTMSTRGAGENGSAAKRRRAGGGRGGEKGDAILVHKCTKLKHTVCFTIQNRWGRRLSEERGSPQVTAPRGTFPRSQTTSPGRATTGYTQTTPPRAEGVPSAGGCVGSESDQGIGSESDGGRGSHVNEYLSVL